MTRALLFFIYAMLAAATLQAQQKKIDSLLILLQQSPKQDTARLIILNDLAFYYNSVDPDKGLMYAGQAIVLAQQTGDKAKLAAGYSNKGVNYYAKGDDSLSLNMYQQALQIHEALKNPVGKAKTYNNMAMVYVNMADYKKALDCHSKSLEILRRIRDSARIATSLTNTGVVYLRMADYPKALDCYLQALAIYEKMNNGDIIGNTLMNIGIVYKNLGKYPLALQYHERALKIFTLSGNPEGKADCFANTGVVYDQMNQPDKALEYYLKALAINEPIGNNRRIANDLTNIGTVYRNRLEYGKAMEFLMKARHLYEQTADKNSLSIVLNEIGDIYNKAPLAALKRYHITANNRYSEALSLQKRALALASDIQAPDRQAESWEHLSETYEAKGDFSSSLQAYKKYTILQDSILNDKTTREITHREIQFSFEKEQALRQAEYDKKQALNTAEINRQHIIKWSLIAGLVLLLTGAAFVFAFYKKSRDAEFNSHVTETEMKVMRLQMNPHFIFNSLNAISDYISRHDIRSADNYLTKFAKVMRLTLENSEQKEVTLAADLKSLELYMQLESLRLPYPFTYRINIDDEINPDETMVPPLILQPFVENSIWHGLSKKQGPGQIIIRIKKEDEMIVCIVEDNGAGRKTTAIGTTAKKSLGIKITKARIDILNKTGNINEPVMLSDLEEGTRVQVKLPFKLSI